MTDRELIQAAEEASKNAYAPYSGFAVGAALECTDGTVFTGCSVETAVYGCALCAEQAAVAEAVGGGKRSFRRIAIVSPSGKEYSMPCGSCRQMLSEFSPEMEVLAVRGDGRYVSYALDELLFHSYNRDNLQR
ncbi:MAG: cytidine deaminase [Oscillospiraceae bacterium]|nr:cytidine deaminase [Oscillospiraceae bacterium]